MHDLPVTVSTGLTVPVVTGGRVEYANLDHAASAPCLDRVHTAVTEILPWSAGVHRGSGLPSQMCTRYYESARSAVRDFAGAPEYATVIFVRNTTDGLNLLARCLPPYCSVLCFSSDHHAAILPWPRSRTQWIPVPATAWDAIHDLDAALRRTPRGPRLVVLTGASNVTGELWPVAELAEVASRHGAQTVLDAAQLAPHRPLRMKELGVDWAVFSGHKMYAPFGAGALVGSNDWLSRAAPYLAGGGATAEVKKRGVGLAVSWRDIPDRHEAGSPNLIGAHALATACRILANSDWERIAAHEQTLLDLVQDGLAELPRIALLDMWNDDHPRVGIRSFTVEGMDPGLLAEVLSAEFGIGVRAGAFCAHQATAAVLSKNPSRNAAGALRVSVGLGTRPTDVARFVDAVGEILRNGPQWTYIDGPEGWRPSPDPRTDLLTAS